MNHGTTTRLQSCLDRMNEGDSGAQDELLRHVCERLRRLTRKLFHHDYARLQPVEQTDDVLQGALTRLHRALSDPAVKPATLAEFFRLATLQIRRELIDLARHHFGPGRPPVILTEPQTGNASTAISPLEDGQMDTGHRPDQLLAWREFHDLVEKLPEEEREVFDLLWYQELTQTEAAEVLKVSVPTIKRRWLSARLRLQTALGGSRPGL
jgi:RNA polymerase sigma-70 factor (ECF subfamily)